MIPGLFRRLVAAVCRRDDRPPVFMHRGYAIRRTDDGAYAVVAYTQVVFSGCPQPPRPDAPGGDATVVYCPTAQDVANFLVVDTARNTPLGTGHIPVQLSLF